MQNIIERSGDLENQIQSSFQDTKSTSKFDEVKKNNKHLTPVLENITNQNNRADSALPKQTKLKKQFGIIPNKTIHKQQSAENTPKPVHPIEKGLIYHEPDYVGSIDDQLLCFPHRHCKEDFEKDIKATEEEDLASLFLPPSESPKLTSSDLLPTYILTDKDVIDLGLSDSSSVELFASDKEDE